MTTGGTSPPLPSTLPPQEAYSFALVIGFLGLSSPTWDTSEIPSLATLVAKNVTGAYFSNEGLLAIIMKAQPHYKRESLWHLSRKQLIEHVDALLAWWKEANPRRASLITEDLTRERGSIRSRSSSSSRRDDCC